MPTFAIQYLQPGREIARISPGEAQARLQAAFGRLPITFVLLGWNLSDVLVNACAEQCERAGVRLYRWQPLLTGDGTFTPPPEWHTVGLKGNHITGFQDITEFTFVCPNQVAVQDAVLSYLHDVLQDGQYQGVFLDRIRYVSPTLNIETDFGCFCDHCQRTAAKEGLDLEAVRQLVTELVTTPEGIEQFVHALFASYSTVSLEPNAELLSKFLDFRCHSITRFVQQAGNWRTAWIGQWGWTVFRLR